MTSQTDVYSLGCVLFEALTGQPPYKRENDLATLWAHVYAPPPSVLEVNPERTRRRSTTSFSARWRRTPRNATPPQASSAVRRSPRHADEDAPAPEQIRRAPPAPVEPVPEAREPREPWRPGRRVAGGSRRGPRRSRLRLRWSSRCLDRMTRSTDQAAHRHIAAVAGGVGVAPAAPDADRRARTWPARWSTGRSGWWADSAPVPVGRASSRATTRSSTAGRPVPTCRSGSTTRWWSRTRTSSS